MGKIEEEIYKKCLYDKFVDFYLPQTRYLGCWSTSTEAETHFTPEKMRDIIDTLEEIKKEFGGMLLGICVTDRYTFGGNDSFSKVPLFEDDKNSDFYLFCTWQYWRSVVINKNLAVPAIDEGTTYSLSRLSGIPVYNSDTYIKRVILKGIYSNRLSVLDYIDKLGHYYWK